MGTSGSSTGAGYGDFDVSDRYWFLIRPLMIPVTGVKPVKPVKPRYPFFCHCLPVFLHCHARMRLFYQYQYQN